MKTYIRDFAYVSAKNELKHRKLIVMNETEDKLEGFDVTYLSRNEAKKATELLCGRHNVHNRISQRPSLNTHRIEGLNEKWFKAWRLFNKSNIANGFYSIDELAKTLIENHKTRSSNINSVKTNLYKALKGKRTAKAYGIVIEDSYNDKKMLFANF